MNATFSRLLALMSVMGVAVGCSTTRRAACCDDAGVVAHATPVVHSAESIYQTESSWTADTGRTQRLGDLAGRPQVVAMFFASCRSTCPVIVNDLRRIEAALSPAMRQRVGFTLVSFDTRRDTPAALAAYREARHLPRPAWTLLRGESEDILELAALLGVSFREDARGDFMHSNQITVLDADGVVVKRIVGLNVEITDTVAMLEKLAAGATHGRPGGSTAR